ncbi:MAG TPA: hypothetical protein VIB00_10745 [Pyrinomonadaceae bacterium]|jgi:hypothetical protein
MLPSLLLILAFDSLLAFNLIQESEIAADFNELGKLLLGGFAAAVVVALAFTFIKLRLREKKPPTTDFLSIDHRKS